MLNFSHVNLLVPLEEREQEWIFLANAEKILWIKPIYNIHHLGHPWKVYCLPRAIIVNRMTFTMG